MCITSDNHNVLTNVEVFVEICRPDAILPRYAHDGDSGMDVYAAGEMIIRPGETVIVPLGIKMAVPKGYEIQARPRSGLSMNTPLRLSNSPGTIDSGYRNEIGIIITNTSEKRTDGLEEEICTLDSKGNKKGIYSVRKGDRIAQLVLQAVPYMSLTVVDSVKDIGFNRNGGFGSTGTR